MKKILPLILIILLVISVLLNIFMVAILLRLQPTRPHEYIIEEFTVADYTWGIETFPKTGNVGEIDGVEDAAQKGMNLWIKYLTINKPTIKYNPINEEPIIVAYDEDADCWLIKGTLPQAPAGYAVAGAVPTAIIKSNGDVVAVWMS